MKADNQDDETQARWRYEVRGSGLYDLREGRPVSVFEAGEILNAHEALLLKEGVWAAKAGLTQGKLDAAEATLSRLRATLEAAWEQGYIRHAEECPVNIGYFGRPCDCNYGEWSERISALLNESTNDPQEVK